jgi:hypothetical protein
MINEIQNQEIELSADELDVVAGGVASLQEFAIFNVSQNSIGSSLSVGPNGVTSLTTATDLDIFSAAFKNVSVS